MSGSWLAACGDGGTDRGSSSATTSRHALIAAFPQSVPHIPAGVPTRLPFLISDSEGVPLMQIDGKVTFAVTRDGRKLDSVAVAPRSNGASRAYLPLTFTFPTSGVYDITAEYDGAKLDATVRVSEPSEVAVPFVGQRLPAVGSPTVADPLGVDPICTREPMCPFHEVNLDGAVGSGRPVVLLVASPAYCQTAVCGPILDILMEQAAGRSDLTVIHSEVYKDAKAQPDLSTATLAPVPEAYHLTFEPVLFVTDRSGTIVARADVAVDRDEMKELLALAV